MGPDTARKEFWSRVHWPWKSISCEIEGNDVIGLTDSPSRGTSLASTAQSGWEKVSPPEAIGAWDQVVSPSAADVLSYLGEA